MKWIVSALIENMTCFLFVLASILLFFTYLLWICHITLVDIWMLNPSCISRIIPAWSQCSILSFLSRHSFLYEDSFLLLLLLFESQSHSVAQAGVWWCDLSSPQPTRESLQYKCEPPHLAYLFLYHYCTIFITMALYYILMSNIPSSPFLQFLLFFLYWLLSCHIYFLQSNALSLSYTPMACHIYILKGCWVAFRNPIEARHGGSQL